jgi:predicted phage tail protein
VAKLPTVTSPLPRDLQQFVQRVREALDSGGPDAVVTARQLIASGVVERRSGGEFTPVGGTIDPARPPRNLSASGALASIILSWDAANYKGHAYTEIWAYTTDAIGEAVLVGMTSGNNFSHTLGAAATRYYWVRNVNQNGVASAYNATNGTQGSTGQDAAYLLDVLTDEITTSQLATALNTRIDLVDAAASVTGSVNARIQTVSSTVGTNTAAIQTNSTAVNGLEAQYTVKIDNNGAVAGFGLASTTTGSGNITSEFIVNADRFAIMRGGSDTTAAVVPFAVQSTQQTINGETVPVGVYMDTAFIKNGTISNAKIGSLTADKITASLLNTVDFYGNTIAGSSIYLGGTVNYDQDSDSNNIGISSVSSPKVAMTSTGAVFAVDAFTIDNPGGTDVVPFSITSDVVSINSALIKDASISLAQIDTANITDLSSIKADIGTVTAGTLQSTDGKFVIDLDNKTISIET